MLNERTWQGFMKRAKSIPTLTDGVKEGKGFKNS